MTENDVRITHAEIPTDGTQLIVDGLTLYGTRVMRDHFPQAVDGLKAVYRRGLWVAHRFPDTGHGSTVAVGEIKVLHDHDPGSIYTTLVRLSQDFRFAPPLMIMHGSGGSYLEDKPAAVRYTSMSTSAFAKDVFFRGIETQALPMMQGMDLQKMEPKYLAPAVPMALVMGNTTVGFGFGSRTPARNLAAICDLVAALCSHLAKGGTFHNFDITKHAEKLLPDFALENVILNAKELLSEYAQGNFDAKIDIEGVAVLTKTSIDIYTLPVGRAFDVVERIRAAIDDAKDKKKDSAMARWIEANVADAQEDPPDKVTITLRKTAVTVFEVWDRVRRLIGFSDSFHPNPNYSNPEGYVHLLTPLQILEIWYQKRHDLILSSKRRQLRGMFEKLRIIEVIRVVSQNTDDVVKLLRESGTSAAAVAQLMRRYNFTQFQAEHVAKTPFSILIREAKEDLEQQHAEMLAKIEALQKSFLEIPQEIAATASEIKRRHGLPRRSRIPAYQGYVAVQGGCIQFESAAEVGEILENFPGVPLQIYSYDGPRLIHVDEQGRPCKGSLSKYTTGDIYGLPFSGDSGYTVNIREDGATCAVRGIVPGLRSEGYFYTTKRSWFVHRSGKIAAGDVPTELSVRKIIGRGAITDIIHIYPYTKQPHYLLFACADDRNVLILQRVTAETTRAIFPPAGAIHTAHHLTGKDWHFTLPQEYLNRLSARVFWIGDADALIGTESVLRLELGQNKWRKHPLIKMLA